MGKIIRYQFMGNMLVFWFLCITVIGIPIGLLYLINGTIRLEDDVSDPEKFVEEYKAGALST